MNTVESLRSKCDVGKIWELLRAKDFDIGMGLRKSRC